MAFSSHCRSQATLTPSWPLRSNGHSMPSHQSAYVQVSCMVVWNIYEKGAFARTSYIFKDVRKGEMHFHCRTRYHSTAPLTMYQSVHNKILKAGIENMCVPNRVTCAGSLAVTYNQFQMLKNFKWASSRGKHFKTMHVLLRIKIRLNETFQSENLSKIWRITPPNVVYSERSFIRISPGICLITYQQNLRTDRC